MAPCAILFYLTMLVNAGDVSGVHMVFDAASRDYFAVPYPSDLRRHPDGTVDRRHYPVPHSNPVSLHYRKVADDMEGFGVTESVFIRFSGPLPDVKLPGPEESVKVDSPVFLVNVDKSSPGYGERIPVYSYFHAHKRGALKNLLGIAPWPGFVLRENTIYAAVVMKSLHPALTGGSKVNEILEGRGVAGEKAAALYAPLVAWLAERNVDPRDVAAATVYTTGDPTKKLRSIIDYIYSLPPTELDAPPAPYRDHTAFYALKSSYTAPQFQTGKRSQLARGGKIFFDEKGAPIVQRMEQIPVVIMVPKGKMPPGGFPLVIYLHGGANTTDEFLDHIIKSKDNAFTPGEGPARTFAEQHIAGVSMGIVKNPERYSGLGESGRFAELPFYNFFRGEVLVANHWQASADASVLLRLMRELRIDPALCPETDASSSPDGMIRFDPELFFAMGFSMGGTILGVWSGVEPGIKATIPAGASGHWGMLIRNFTWGEDMPWFFGWLTNGEKGEAMDARWPAMSLIQAVLEPADTITYGPHVFRRPFPGHPARHVYLAVGKNDFYTKPLTQNAVITALGLPLVGPIVESSIMMNERLMGHPEPQDFPVSHNTVSEGGREVTAAALQYEPDTWTNEGHNVDYNLTETKHQYGCFLRTLIDTGTPVIPPPGPEGSPCVMP